MVRVNVDDPLVFAAMARGERGPSGHLQFPMDPDELDRLFADDRRYRIGPLTSAPADAGDGADGVAVAAGRVELILYVSSNSLPCARAIASLRSMVALFPPGRVTFEVRDVAQHTDAAARDRILFTPTLLCGTGAPTGPRAWRHVEPRGADGSLADRGPRRRLTTRLRLEWARASTLSRA